MDNEYMLRALARDRAQEAHRTMTGFGEGARAAGNCPAGPIDRLLLRLGEGARQRQERRRSREAGCADPRHCGHREGVRP